MPQLLKLYHQLAASRAPTLYCVKACCAKASLLHLSLYGTLCSAGELWVLKIRFNDVSIINVSDAYAKDANCF